MTKLQYLQIYYLQESNLRKRFDTIYLVTLYEGFEFG